MLKLQIDLQHYSFLMVAMGQDFTFEFDWITDYKINETLTANITTMVL